MDKFARNYLIGLTIVVVAGVLWFAADRDPRIGEINAMLRADPLLADYPYVFQVRELNNGVAVMGSPRSAEVPVMQFLRTAFPELSRTAVDDPAMMAAQDDLARRQSHAAEIVTAQPDVRSVRWQLDEKWFREHAVFLDL
jgi:hypothetical protein